MGSWKFRRNRPISKIRCLLKFSRQHTGNMRMHLGTQLQEGFLPVLCELYSSSRNWSVIRMLCIMESLRDVFRMLFRSFSTRYDDARDVPDHTHSGPRCDAVAPAMFTLRMSKDTEALGEEVREQRSFQTETRICRDRFFEKNDPVNTYSLSPKIFWRGGIRFHWIFFGGSKIF